MSPWQLHKADYDRFLSTIQATEFREQFKLLDVDFEGRIFVENDFGEQLKFHHGQAFIDL